MTIRETSPARRNQKRSIRAETCAALFPARVALGGALLWGSANAFSAFVGTFHWATTHHLALVCLLFGLGGALAFPVAFLFAELVTGKKRRSARFAAAFIFLSLGTILFTAVLFSLNYRIYHAAWPHAPFSRIWLLQVAFTVAGTFYQFAVIGLRLYFPIGFIALFGASLWYSQRSR